jgi:hypothetical protein
MRGYPGVPHQERTPRSTSALNAPGVNTNVLSPPDFLDEPFSNGAVNGIPVTVVDAGT